MTKTNDCSPRRALFPGSFDPFTVGHASIVERGLRIFDEIVIAIGVSVDKVSDASTEVRLATINRLYEGNSRIKVVAYAGLTVDAAEIHGCRFLLRGVRNVKDFEYEKDMADVNLKLSGIETVILLTRPELSAVSSSLVRELEHFGRDVSEFIP